MKNRAKISTLIGALALGALGGYAAHHYKNPAVTVEEALKKPDVYPAALPLAHLQTAKNALSHLENAVEDNILTQDEVFGAPQKKNGLGYGVMRPWVTELNHGVRPSEYCPHVEIIDNDEYRNRIGSEGLWAERTLIKQQDQGMQNPCINLKTDLRGRNLPAIVKEYRARLEGIDEKELAQKIIGEENRKRTLHGLGWALFGTLAMGALCAARSNNTTSYSG